MNANRRDSGAFSFIATIDTLEENAVGFVFSKTEQEMFFALLEE
ncbi:MAG: hypothetical protein AAGU27_13875 [Dehalobacterium sp.]